MRVEVDLYSGRRNPRFQLTAAATGEVFRRLEELPRISRPNEQSEVLGYRGLTIDQLQPESGMVRIGISQGVVAIEGLGGPRHLEDRGQGLEKWLVSQASSFLNAGEVEVIRATLRIE